jgi:hypothetical protein
LSSPLKRGKNKWGIVFSNNRKKAQEKAQISRKTIRHESLFKVMRYWELGMHD